jgi:hypothetical protein
LWHFLDNFALQIVKLEMHQDEEQLTLVQLPKDMILSIAQFTTFPDFACFIRTCSTFHEITIYEDIWRFFFIRQLEAEKKAIANINNKKSRAHMKRIEKNLKRHMNYDHPRFIEGTEFVRVLKYYIYTNVVDSVTTKAYTLHSGNSVAAYCDTIEYVNRICTAFIPDKPSAKLKIFDDLGYYFQEKMCEHMEKEGTTDPVLLDRFFTCMRSLFEAGQEITEGAVFKLLNAPTILDKLLDFALLPQSESFYSHLFYYTYSIARFDYHYNQVAQVSPAVLRVLVPKLFSYDMFKTLVLEYSYVILQGANLEKLNTMEELAGIRFVIHESNSLAAHDGVYNNNADMNHIMWILERGTHPSVLSAVLSGAVLRTCRDETKTDTFPFLQLLLDRGCDLNSECAHLHFTYAIYAALTYRKFELAQWLLDHGANLEISEKHLAEEMKDAVSTRRLDVVEFIKGKCKKGLKYYMTLEVEDLPSAVDKASLEGIEDDESCYKWLEDYVKASEDTE